MITIFSGSAVSDQKDASLMYSIFTRHAGGEFDTSMINEGTSFRLTYTGEKNGLGLTLLSHSGSVHWARMSADETIANPDGSYTGIFSYQNIIKTYGNRFNLLDEVRAVSNTDAHMVCTRIDCIPGTGEPADKLGGSWIKPSEGIAFIGDSITQNVFFNEGDFNTLLGRTDCVNFGIGGQTSRNLKNRIDEVAGRHFSRLVIWCGINDIGYGFTAEETFSNIRSMVEAMRAKNEGISFVIISILPTTDAFYKGEQHKISERNELLKAYAAENSDISFVDCYPYFLGEDGYCKDGLTLDGLHPNSNGYAIVKEKLLEVL